jgi:uncharacterized repeat protein (TIGR04076 family)
MGKIRWKTKLGKYVKISVVKQFHPEDVIGHQFTYANGLVAKPCQAMKEGDEFIVDNIERMPTGFCGWAWRDIYKDLSVLYFGGNFGPWKDLGTQYTSCSDGLKPVCFKLERIED